MKNNLELSTKYNRLNYLTKLMPLDVSRPILVYSLIERDQTAVIIHKIKFAIFKTYLRFLNHNFFLFNKITNGQNDGWAFP